MRIRTIKPEFWRSPDVSRLDIETRLLFIGLWSYVDDNGVGADRESVIAADLFADDMARDPRETLARIQRGLATLSESGMITRYTVDNRDYLYISNWERHQRIDKPNKPRLPLPTSENAEFARLSRDSRDTLAPGTGEQGNRGTGEQNKSEVAGDDSDAANVLPLNAEIIERPDVEQLLDRLDEQIEANGNRKPNRNKKNHDAMRLLLDRDGYTPEQVGFIIDWAQSSDFWQANVLSAVKLRSQMTQLVAQARRDSKRKPAKAEETAWAVSPENTFVPAWARS